MDVILKSSRTVLAALNRHLEEMLVIIIINILGRLQVGKPKTDVVFSLVYPPHIVNK
jgi:hypothetical protein